jgi:hypothetical protein
MVYPAAEPDFGARKEHADSCGAACEAPLPWGFSVRARGGYLLWPQGELGLELGYAKLKGRYSKRSDTLEPQGAKLPFMAFPYVEADGNLYRLFRHDSSSQAHSLAYRKSSHNIMHIQDLIHHNLDQ